MTRAIANPGLPPYCYSAPEKIMISSRVRANMHFVSAMAVFLVIGGCASIVTGTSQDITFQTFPNGAELLIDGKSYGTTPVVATLDKKKNVSAVLAKDGFKPVLMEITTETQPWFWGNFMFGGLVGSTTDNLSGAIHQYSPNQYFITLEPLTAASLENGVVISQLEAITKFVVTRHSEILQNATVGNGEDLDSLMQMLDIGSERVSDEVKVIAALSLEHPNPVSLAVTLTQKYLPVGPVVRKSSQRRNPGEAYRDGAPTAAF